MIQHKNMVRRNKLISTYGRHRLRVVTTEGGDIFASNKTDQSKNVFSSFSSSGSASTSHSRLMSDSTDRGAKSFVDDHSKDSDFSWCEAGNRKQLADISNTRQMRNKRGKRVPSRDDKSSLDSLEEEGATENYSIKDSHRYAATAAEVSKPKPRQTRKGHGNKTINKKSTNLMDTPSRDNKLLHPNDYSTNINKSELSSVDGMNFSEFDKYSLIISDCGPDLQTVPPTPEIEMHTSDHSQSTDAFTSTPHTTRLQPKASLYSSLMRESDISHIDMIEESPEPVALRTRGHISALALTAEPISVLSEIMVSTQQDADASQDDESIDACIKGVGEMSIAPNVDKSEFTGLCVNMESSPSNRFRTYNLPSQTPSTGSNLRLPVINTPSCYVKLQRLSLNDDPHNELVKDNLDCIPSKPSPVPASKGIVGSSLPSSVGHGSGGSSSSNDVSKSLFDSTKNSHFTDTECVESHVDSVAVEGNTDCYYTEESSMHVSQPIEEEKADIVHRYDESDVFIEEPSIRPISEADAMSDSTELYYNNSTQNDTSDSKNEQSGSSRYMLASDISSIEVEENHGEGLDSIVETSQCDTSAKSCSKYYSCDSHVTKNSRSSYSDPDTSMEDSITRRRKLKNKLLDNIKEDLESSCHSLMEMLSPVKLRKINHEVSPMEKILALCDQTEPKTFLEVIPPIMMRKCVKIGEGVYGEVFRTQRNRESVALKIIPIEGDFPVNDEPQKTFAEMIPELVISKELSDLSEAQENNTKNFVTVKGISIVEGAYPDKLLQEWDSYHERKMSENDRPDVFQADQLFVVFEFEDAGCDLEGVTLDSLMQARSILFQVTCSLAIAEVSLQFEHRDLHWGNVLVRDTFEDTLWYQLDGQDFGVDTHGVKVSIIDFTLSRLTKDGCSVFTDLSTDPTLFEGQGDYQFEVYREMKEENENNWKTHHPYSNVLWIHYLADKLLNAKSYKTSQTKEHKSMARKMRTFIREIPDYRSALHLLRGCPFFSE